MTTKITGLSKLNVRALRETMPLVETTATTATFDGNAATALSMVELTISRLSGRAHPKASLHAVARKLRAQVLNAPQPVPAEPTLEQKVVASVQQRAPQYYGSVMNESAPGVVDVWFRHLGDAGQFVQRFGLYDVAVLRDVETKFNVPVVITFAVSDYARINSLS